MNRRRELNILFNLASRIIAEDLQAAKRTESKRVKATLHLAYEKEQLEPVLGFLKANHTNLYRSA